MPGFEPGTSGIGQMSANYYTIAASLKKTVKFRNKSYIANLMHFMNKIPAAAKVQTTFFGLIMT